MKNSQYLKQYVQMHPDNKMAWYLLGKEYKKNGQEGKANYCFNQAGGVYEAFEQSKVPSDMLREYEEELLRTAREREMRTSRIRRVLLLVSFLLLILMPAAAKAPGDGSMMTAVKPEGQTKTVPAAQSSLDQEKAGDSTADTLLFTAREADGAVSARGLAGLVGSGGGKVPSLTAVLGMQRSGKWLLWKERLPVAYTVEREENGRTTIQSYDSASCACKPPDAGALADRGAKWQRRQEQLATLWSALNSFRAAKGRLPESLGEMTGDFPGNWLAGTTPLMERAFTPLKAEAERKGEKAAQGAAADRNAPGGDSGAAPGDAPSAGNGGAEMPFLSQPLAILVDKQKHRLAVTSGGIIIRSYEVGLGGTRTPEGSFVITDKVVNPNGHDKGEFGSRGMQLSDTNYAIHGTNEPESVGKDESMGCIRMKRNDIEELFDLVPKGTKVQITEGGLLPGVTQGSENPFSLKAAGNQTNPRKQYHWLN
ncbi:Lipoprotein-anchoring transpeptidase ErfK/SrfK [Paenibacillus sophorae]|uniref:L,D-transpeptidase n=1 Tax=Paenibacillus sophorae TaxID=1333845 RepID=A0A1H8TYJ7_9BACL|nr:L,D-transpeptidase [Paenibacillus sophorae]QWU18075.1 L,D-transpeptidase [Paenibacillus sophorae]SEO95498.1 Lipoprotein-anchoring transpeptidase ErfK/SrfK [Paenibacillus sophorae]